jgi:ectoine hydroxylase-related dioxygenase (phytanoyl-CoA dioxygenase family)
MTWSLTEEEARAWREDGFFAREAAFSLEEIEELREAAERVVTLAARASASGEAYAIDGNRYVEAADSTVQFEHAPGSATIRVIEPFHHFDARFERLLDDPRIVEPMRGVIGSETVALWTDKLNLKRPLEGSAFRWHQDSPYWTHVCAHVDRLPNVMLTLDDADEANGCFRVVRGSHAQGCLPGLRDETTLGPLFTDPAYFDESEQVAIEVPAGSLVFFSPHTVHGSLPNESSKPRRALVLTYQPGDRPMFKRPGTRNCGAHRAS